jgi:heptaprenyl diphosphate synthase
LSAIDERHLAYWRRKIFLALFTALAVALHTVESLLPTPAPWFRPGFANVLTLLALFLYGAGSAWALTLARIGIGSLLLGQFFSPGFFLSLAGGVAACTLMTAARALFGRHLGPVGASALGATGHAGGQMLVAWLILVRHPGVWQLFPFFLLVALLTGIVNGLFADYLLQQLRTHPAFSAALAPRCEKADKGKFC